MIQPVDELINSQARRRIRAVAKLNCVIFKAIHHAIKNSSDACRDDRNTTIFNSDSAFTFASYRRDPQCQPLIIRLIKPVNHKAENNGQFSCLSCP
jgi:hypothetical protein